MGQFDKVTIGAGQPGDFDVPVIVVFAAPDRAARRRPIGIGATVDRRVHAPAPASHDITAHGPPAHDENSDALAGAALGGPSVMSESCMAFRRSKRWRILVLGLVALAAFASLAVRSSREPVLRAAGWALVTSEPIAAADVIVLTVDSGAAGALEAADLVQEGISKRVAIFMDPPDEKEREFIRRGVPYDSDGARQIQRLRLLGVTDVVQISEVDGSEGEGLMLPQWCDEHQFGSIIVVATKDHSRRLRRVLDRAMKGHLTRITVQPARYSDFDPDQWWKTRGGIRTEIVELQKLLLDFARHPISL